MKFLAYSVLSLYIILTLVSGDLIRKPFIVKPYLKDRQNYYVGEYNFDDYYAERFVCVQFYIFIFFKISNQYLKLFLPELEIGYQVFTENWSEYNNDKH